MGTVLLISSMAKRHAANAASRWAEATAMITLRFGDLHGPERCARWPFGQIGHLCARLRADTRQLLFRHFRVGVIVERDDLASFIVVARRAYERHNSAGLRDR